MKKHNKIRRTREQFIFYAEMLNELCEKHNLTYYCFITQHNKLRIGKPYVHYIILVNTVDTDEFKPDGIYRTRMYGNELNAFGDVIDYIERNFKK